MEIYFIFSLNLIELMVITVELRTELNIEEFIIQIRKNISLYPIESHK